MKEKGFTEDEIKAFLQALEFYADPQTYGLFGGNSDRIMKDAGKLARKVIGRREY